jgi:ribose/xylose/arabinose/galactoside ABC-type transport system permease subunit
MTNQAALQGQATHDTRDRLVRIGRVLKGSGLIWALVILCVTASLVSPFFLNKINLLNVLRQVSLFGVVAVGMTFVILTRGIDLSVGSIVALVGVLAATLLAGGTPIPIAIAAGLAAGTLVGVVNGLGVTLGHVPPFIMTLGTMVMGRGVALIIADGGTVNMGAAADGFFWLGGGFLYGIPVPIWLFAAVCIVSFVVLQFTPFGRQVYAVGSNEEAARLSGINVGLVTLSVYAISGFLSAFGGLLFLSRLSVGDPNSGLGLELEAITIVVIGGTSLFGGEGGVGGTIIGAIILAVLANILNLVGVSPFSQQVVKGAIIVFAVLLETGKRRRK